ncbi:MAG: hypothetical protein H7255_02000 [Ramlibacter sp.]|nr:hypothetical protein [Ramlibacter sp.]
MKNALALSTATRAFKGHQNDLTAGVGASALRFLTRKEQHKVILAALRHGPKTTDFLRSIGAFQAPTRIHELRALGYSLETALVWAWGSDGRSHRMALYTLHEPTEPWVRPTEGGK